MERVLSERWVKVSAGVAVALLAVTLACAAYFRVWGWRDLQTYRALGRECHPVWRELYRGRIHAGQDVEQVIAETQPVRVERYGEFVRLHYQPGLSYSGVTIAARNGRLVGAAAWSCTWDRVFFDETTQDDRKAYSEAYEAHWERVRKEQAGAEPGAGADGLRR